MLNISHLKNQDSNNCTEIDLQQNDPKLSYIKSSKSGILALQLPIFSFITGSGAFFNKGFSSFDNTLVSARQESVLESDERESDFLYQDSQDPSKVQKKDQDIHGFDWFFYKIWSNPEKRRSFVKSIIFWSVVIGGLFALFFWPSTTHHGTVEPSLNSRFWNIFSDSSSHNKSQNSSPGTNTNSNKAAKNQNSPFIQSVSAVSYSGYSFQGLSKTDFQINSQSLIKGFQVVDKIEGFVNNFYFGKDIFGLIAASETAQGKPIDPCAIGPCPINFDNAKGGTVGETANNIFINVAQVLTFVSASIAVFFIVYNGFSMMTADGDSSKYMKAWMGVLYSILGLVVSVAAYSLVAALLGILGNWK